MKNFKLLKHLLFIHLIMILTSTVFAEESIYLVGSHNSWVFNADSKAKIKENLGLTEYYGITISPVFNNEFKLTTDDGWTNVWSADYWIDDYNKKWDIGADGNNAIWKDSSNLSNFIHLCIEKPSNYYNTNIPIGIMTLSAAPITIDSIEQAGIFIDSAYYANMDTQNVNIYISNSKSNEEKIYIRYTTDNWSSDNFVLASYVNDTIYTAEIKTNNLPRNTQVEYYAFTTTLLWSDNNDLDNFTDLMTINYKLNSGNNYKYYTNKNHSPEIISEIINQSINENDSLIIIVEANDIDNDTLFWSAKNLPDGAIFIDNQNNSATFTWKPNYIQNGIYENISFIVTDSNNVQRNIIIKNSQHIDTEF